MEMDLNINPAPNNSEGFKKLALEFDAIAIHYEKNYEKDSKAQDLSDDYTNIAGDTRQIARNFLNNNMLVSDRTDFLDKTKAKYDKLVVNMKVHFEKYKDGYTKNLIKNSEAISNGFVNKK